MIIAYLPDNPQESAPPWAEEYPYHKGRLDGCPFFIGDILFRSEGDEP